MGLSPVVRGLSPGGRPVFGGRGELDGGAAGGGEAVRAARAAAARGGPRSAPCALRRARRSPTPLRALQNRQKSARVL